MIRLVRDRYFAYDQVRGCDLTTGEDVRLDELAEDAGEGGGLPALVEVLNNGRDGDPRWIVAEARNGMQAAAMIRRAAVDARRCGFVPVLVPLYVRLRAALADDLNERTLLLIGSFAKSMVSARTALVDAAAQSPRPHVLLTFRSAPTKARW